MAISSTALLYGAIALLMIDSVMELSFISSMVAWLHTRAGRSFEVQGPNGPFALHGKPEHLLVDQGHASNGASGSALIVVGMGGILALWLRNRQLHRHGTLTGFPHALYTFWVYFTPLSAIFSLAAWVYVLVQTYDHDGQSINLDVASKLNNQPYPNYVAYPLDEWTPQNWFAAVLGLPLTSNTDRSDIRFHLRVQYGWEWNLIPMTILGFVVAVLAFQEKRLRRQWGTKGGNNSFGEKRYPDSPS